MSHPEDRWHVSKPQWAGRLDMPLARLMHRTEDDSLIVIMTLGAWFIIVLVLALLEAFVHAVIVNPIRRLFVPGVRTAGWTVEIEHSQPTDPVLLPSYKRNSLHETRTETTLWIAKKTPAKTLSRELREYLKSGGQLNDPQVSSMFAVAGAKIVKTERRLVT